jgi:hypothetical protein
MQQQVNLTATPNLGKNNEVEWTLAYGKVHGKKCNFPPVPVAHGDTAKFTIVIDNPPDMNIEFSSDPLWVAVGTDCPQTFSEVPDQITDIEKHKKRLTFIDRNRGKQQQTLTYRLNFVDADNNNAPVEPLDPEIRNSGGGPGLRDDLSSRALLGIALVGIGLVAVAGLFLPRR